MAGLTIHAKAESLDGPLPAHGSSTCLPCPSTRPLLALSTVSAETIWPWEPRRQGSAQKCRAMLEDLVHVGW